MRQIIRQMCIVLGAVAIAMAEQVGHFSLLHSVPDGGMAKVPAHIVAMSPKLGHLQSTVDQIQQNKPVAIFLMMDQTGSMMGRDVQGSRYEAIQAILDQIHAHSPQSEIGGVFFGADSWFDCAEDALFAELPVADLILSNGYKHKRGYIPLLTMNKNYSSTVYASKSGVDLFRNFWQQKKTFSPAESTSLALTSFGYSMSPANYPNHHMEWSYMHGPGKGNGNMNFGSSEDGYAHAFEMARQAFAKTSIPKEDQYIIFISDGDINLSYFEKYRTRATNPHATDLYKLPTLFTLFYTDAGGTSTTDKLKQVRDSIRSNKYSPTVSKSEIWNVKTRAEAMDKVNNNILSVITADRVVSPSQVTINGISSISGDSSRMAHWIPLRKSPDSLLETIQFKTMINGVSTGALQTVTKNFSVATGFNTYPTDTIAVDWWDRDITISSPTGAPLSNITLANTALRFGFTQNPKTAGYSYDSATLILEADNGDRESILLNAANGWMMNLPFGRSSSVSANGSLDFPAGISSLKITFRNPELPLDTLVKLIPVNLPSNANDPSLTADSILVREGGDTSRTKNGTLDLRSLASDLDPNSTLSVEIVGSGTTAHGVFGLNSDGSFVYRHDGTESTRDSVTLRAFDGERYSTAKKFYIRIIGVNSNPVLKLVRQRAKEDSLFTYVVQATDKENATGLIYSLGVLPFNAAGMTINPLTGQIAWTPSFESATVWQVKIPITVRDLDQGISTDTLWIDVDPVNDAPSGRDTSFAIAENPASGALVGRIVANDPDNTSLNFSLLATSDRWTLTPDGRLLVKDPAKIDFEAQKRDSLWVLISDGALDTAIQVWVNIDDLAEKANLILQSVVAVDSTQRWSGDALVSGQIYTNRSIFHVTYLADGLHLDTLVALDSALIQNRFGSQEVVKIYRDSTQDAPDTVRFTLNYNTRAPEITWLDAGKRNDSSRIWIVNQKRFGSLGSKISVQIKRVDLNLVQWLSADTAWNAQLKEGEVIAVGIIAHDIYGNTTTDTIQVLLDTTAPVVVIRSPSKGAKIYGLKADVDWTVDGKAMEIQTRESLRIGGNLIIRSFEDFAGNVGSDTTKVVALLGDLIQVEVENNLISQSDLDKELDYFSKKNEGRKNSGSLIPDKESYNLALQNSIDGKLEEILYSDGTANHQIKPDERVGMDSSLVLGARVKITLQFPLLSDSTARCADGMRMWNLHVNGIAVNIYDQIGQFVSSVSVPAFDIDKVEYQKDNGSIEAFLEIPKLRNDLRSTDGRRWGNGVYLLNVRVQTVAEGINCNSGAVNPARFSTMARIGYIREQ